MPALKTQPMGHCIIPSEDCQRTVEMDGDEDDDSGDETMDSDGGQDERDPADDYLSTPDMPPHIRHPIAPWLLST